MGEGTKINTTITPPNLQTGLVGHWTFDGPDMQWQTTGAEVRDVSGQGNHGAIMGGLTNRSGVAGMIGQGMGFDGISNVVNANPPTALLGSNTFTVSFWAKSPGYFASSTALAIRAGTGNNGLFISPYRFIGSANRHNIFYNSNTIMNVVTALDPTKWNHFVFRSSSATDHRLFVNTEQVALNSSTRTLSGSLTDVTIGANFSPGTQFYNGNIDDVRIYSRPLSEAEILQLYRLGARE